MNQQDKNLINLVNQSNIEEADKIRLKNIIAFNRHVKNLGNKQELDNLLGVLTPLAQQFIDESKN
jgi:hypothetical protein